MSNEYTVADAIDAPPSGKGCVSVLDYADGQAKAFRTGQQNAAAQEAVPYGYVFTDDPEKFAMPGGGFHLGPVPPKDAINVIPLYAAPVAAAPVVAYMIDGRVEQGLTFDKAAAESMANMNCGTVRPLVFADSTPAAPGIDHLRSVINTLSRSISDAYEAACLNGDERMQTVQNARQSLLNTIREAMTLIDASPKGGSTWAFVADEVNEVIDAALSNRTWLIPAETVEQMRFILLQATGAEVDACKHRSGGLSIGAGECNCVSMQATSAEVGE